MADSQHAWLRTVEDHPAVVQLRTDAHGRLLELAQVLAWSADWSTRTSRPTWERLCDRTGLGRRTVARWLAWLRTAGLLGVVESGSTPELRPMALAHLEGNRAALYVLATPTSSTQAPAAALSVAPVDETGTPSGLTEGESPSAGARDDATSPLRGPDSRTAATKSTGWGWCQPTKTRSDRLDLVQRLQERVPALRPLTERHLRHLLRPWLISGWTAADVLWAIDHAPDGTARTWTTDVRSPKGWLTYRLTAWTDTTGAPLGSLSAAREAAAATVRAEQAVRRAQAAAGRAQIEAQRSLGDRLQAVAADRWARLLEQVTPRRRRPGPMSEALARTAVLAQLGRPAEEASDDELTAALAAAVERAEVAA